MKQYFASADEMFVKKGQRVYPREEAVKMIVAKGLTGLTSMFDSHAFWTMVNDGIDGWVYIEDKNVPTCVETEDKDAFREWLEAESKKPYGAGCEPILSKYDELHDVKTSFATGEELPKQKPVPSEAKKAEQPKPLFEVGETISLTATKFKYVVESRCFENNKWFYTVRSSNGITIEDMNEQFFSKLPKTKLVFSLEKWVDMAKGGLSAKDFITRYEEAKKYSGLTFNEVLNKYGVAFTSDLFVEVEVK